MCSAHVLASKAEARLMLKSRMLLFACVSMFCVIPIPQVYMKINERRCDLRPLFVECARVRQKELTKIAYKIPMKLSIRYDLPLCRSRWSEGTEWRGAWCGDGVVEGVVDNVVDKCAIPMESKQAANRL